MIWIITVSLVGTLVPNLVKLLSVSTRFISIIPVYYSSVLNDRTILEDKETRRRMENAFTKIFFSIQIHALNVAILAMLGWSVWYGQVPNLSSMLKGIVFGVILVAGLSNLSIACSQIKDFFILLKLARANAKVADVLNMDPPEPIAYLDVVQLWAWIGLYSGSAVACAGLYLMWL